MFSEGHLLYITPYYFNNEQKPKNKYFLVIKDTDDKKIICSLPSSQDHIPKGRENTEGCYNDPDKCLSFYKIPKNKPVTDQGFAFPLDTILYLEYVQTIEKAYLESTYYIQGIDFEFKGKLSADLLENIRDCIRKSGMVKQRIKRLL